jgi:anti-sigma B factor antagonist
MSEDDREALRADFDRVERGDVVVLVMRGSLDVQNSASIKAETAAFEQAGTKKILVDLGELRQIDSSGVGALMSLYKRVRNAGGQVCFAAAAGQPKAVLKVLRFDKTFAVYDTIDEAMQRLAGS